ncbi:AAA family ATPase [Candidatus Acetothermia bacterium]|jgi:MoxR-like ATPase|nr:AAA family ATPase [Candidatus Acetothermia bacterium]MCI2431469.1 AAA family ATPase [Candidatus Acetothermia bacterium]MCI2436431.1 AAA family ATPase [Candidatus Acetothermia bacterium]
MNETQVRELQEKFQSLVEEIRSVIIGQEEVIQQTLIGLLCGEHLLLEGVPGLGKTLLVRTLGQALGLKFSRIQFTPDLMPADIIGTRILLEDDSGRRYFEFARGPVFANLILADEINRATPKTQSALLEAMQERSVTTGGETHKLEEPFMVLGTQNPIEMEGTYPLPEAQIDRFFFKILLTYPALGELQEIVDRHGRGGYGISVRQVLTRAEILEAQKLVGTWPIASPLRRYAARLVYATQPTSESAPDSVKKYVEYGASPRAALALVRGAKAHAFLAGEWHARIVDIQAVYYPSMRHRMIRNFRGEAEGIPVEEILKEVFHHVRPEE